MRKILMFAATMAFALGTFLASCSAQAQAPSHTAQLGAYSVTLKVLPAESFGGRHSAMEWTGGAKPHFLTQSPRPNHHMVVFIKKDGKPVENASVTLLYHSGGAGAHSWKKLPVARMFVRGNGRATTHFGNNVFLRPGAYVVRVTVNGSAPHLFHIRIHGGH